MAPTRPPIFADTDLLAAAAERGHVVALAEIQAGRTFVTPNQLREFLNVQTGRQRKSRRAFLRRETVELLGGPAASAVARQSVFQTLFRRVVPYHGRGDAALAAFALQTGFEAVTMDGRLFNFLALTLRGPRVPVRRVV